MIDNVKQQQQQWVDEICRQRVINSNSIQDSIVLTVILCDEAMIQQAVTI